MTRYLFFIVVWWCSLSVFAQERFSVEMAKAYGVQNHPSLKMSDFDIEEANSTIKETRAIGLPKLKAGVNYQYFLQKPQTPFSLGFAQGATNFQDADGTERLVSYIVTDDQNRPVPAPDQLVAFVRNNNLVANLELSSLIFDVSYIHALKATKTFKEYYEVNKVKTKQDIKEQIEQAFNDVLFIQSNVSTVDNNIDNLSKTLFEVEESYKSGFVEKLDVDRLKLSLSNLQNERANLIRNIDRAKLFLKYQMNYPLDEEITIEGDLEKTAESLIAVGVPSELSTENRAENKIFEITNQLNDLNIKTIEASYYPNLAGFIQHQQQIQRDNLFDNGQAGFIPSTIVGLNLSATIFDGWARDAKMEKAIIDKNRNIEREKEFNRGLNLQIQASVVGLENAINSALESKKSLELATEIYRVTQIKYKEGVGSSIELQQAEQGLYGAQANYLQKLYDVFKGRFELNKALGNL